MSSIDALSSLGAINAASANTTDAPAMPAQNPGAILDGEAFLKLLVAQLKHQDPSSPADTSQMLTQSAQLSMVERLNEISASLTESTTMNRMALAGSMIGRDVTFLDDGGELVAAPVEAVRFEAGEIVLHAGGFAIPLDAVIEVRDATTSVGYPSSVGTFGAGHPADHGMGATTH